MNGTIKSINGDKKYGFIRADDGKEYFFHKDDIHGFWDELSLGAKVEFESVVSPKGPRASNVILVDQFGTHNVNKYDDTHHD